MKMLENEKSTQNPDENAAVDFVTKININFFVTL